MLAVWLWPSQTAGLAAGEEYGGLGVRLRIDNRMQERWQYDGHSPETGVFGESRGGDEDESLPVGVARWSFLGKATEDGFFMAVGGRRGVEVADGPVTA